MKKGKKKTHKQQNEEASEGRRGSRSKAGGPRRGIGGGRPRSRGLVGGYWEVLWRFWGGSLGVFRRSCGFLWGLEGSRGALGRLLGLHWGAFVGSSGAPGSSGEAEEEQETSEGRGKAVRRNGKEAVRDKRGKSGKGMSGAETNRGVMDKTAGKRET